MTTVVIDYGAGNMRSVLNALDELGEEVRLAASPAELDGAARIILPGVGAFAPAMARLRESGLAEAIDRAVRDGAPYLGICLGMQLMARVGHEGGAATEGFGWVDAEVVALEPAPPLWRSPHIGWSVVSWRDGGPLTDGLRREAAFYFCHGFHVVGDAAQVMATAGFNGEITAGLRAGAAMGVQFHPERSGAAGLKLLENFLDAEATKAAVA